MSPDPFAWSKVNVDVCNIVCINILPLFSTFFLKDHEVPQENILFLSLLVAESGL